MAWQQREVRSCLALRQGALAENGEIDGLSLTYPDHGMAHWPTVSLCHSMENLALIVEGLDCARPVQNI